MKHPIQTEIISADFELEAEQGLYCPPSIKQEPLQKITINSEFAQMETELDEPLLMMQKQ